MPKSKTEQQAAEPTFTPLPKLALGVITSPKDAFEEIVRRKLLGVGLAIVAAVGAILAILTPVNFYLAKRGSLFDFGGNSPLGTIGMLLITAWAADRLARLVGGEGNYVDLLAVLGWANVVQFVGLAAGMVPFVSALASIWAIVVSIIGLQQAHRITMGKAAVAYVGAALLTTGISVLRLPSLLIAFLARYYLSAAYPPLASEIPSQAAGWLPGQIIYSWIVAAALVAAAAMVPRLIERNPRVWRSVLSAIAAAAVGVGAVTTIFALKIDPVGGVVKGVRAYRSQEAPNPGLAAKRFRRVLEYYPSDAYVQLYLAHSEAAAGDYKRAVEAYDDIRKAMPGDAAADAITRTGIGTARYSEGSYAAARDEFEKAAELWRGYAEPRARLGLAYLRLGDPKKAIDAAREAIDSKGDGWLPQVVLAQAYTTTGQAKKAQEAAKTVAEIDKALSDRLSTGPGGWRTAIERLTPLDLRMPLDLPKAPPPGQAKKK